MKRWVLFLLLVTLACVTPTLSLETQTSVIPLTETITQQATPTIVVQPTFTPTPMFIVTEIPPHESQPQLDQTSIHIYPSKLFPNDYFSIDVKPKIPPHITGPMTVTVGFQDGSFQSQPIEEIGLVNERRARFIWVNQVPDNLSPLTMTYSLVYPTGMRTSVTDTISLTMQTNLHPQDLMTLPEPDARWVLTRTTGFTIHYITGTRAERDLDIILSEANQTYMDITNNLGRYRENVDIYVLDRIIGQGGYASSGWIAISYTDRSYTPIGLGSLLKHELTHRLDAAIGCSEAPAFVREGLAVYMAGGHYRAESITTRASAALTNGYTIPFTQLLTEFYQQQHEISYLEAAAFLSFIFDNYSWNGIKDLCEISSQTEGTDLVKMDAASQHLENIDISHLFSRYRLWLSHQAVQSVERELFDLELKLMELMRRYQLEYDQAAHFLEGVLFNPQEGVRQGIVADFVRGPTSAESIALELLLAAGQDAIIRQDIQFLKTILNLLESVIVDGNSDIDIFSEVERCVSYLLNLGFEPYHLAFLGDGQYQIAVLNYGAWPQTSVVQIGWLNDKWIITDVR